MEHAKKDRAECINPVSNGSLGSLVRDGLILNTLKHGGHIYQRRLGWFIFSLSLSHFKSHEVTCSYRG